MSFDVMGPDAYNLLKASMVLSNIYVGADWEIKLRHRSSTEA